MKNTIAFSLALFTFLFLVKNEAAAQPQQIDESYAGVKKIDLDIAIGNVAVGPAKGSQIDVKGFYDGDKLKVKVEQDGSKLTITEKTRERDNNDIRSRWEILVPADMEMEANLGTGNMDITKYTGALEGNCGTGDLTLVASETELSWNCGTGDYVLTNCEGEFELNTGTGDVRLTNVRGRTSVNSGTGDLDLTNCRGEIDANSGTGDVEASNLAILKASSFNSGTGHVDVKLGAQTNADLTVNSGTGNAELDMNGQDFNGTLTMYCNKRSGNIKAPFSFDKEWTEEEGRRQTLHKSKRFGNSDVEVKVGTGSGRALVK